MLFYDFLAFSLDAHFFDMCLEMLFVFFSDILVNLLTCSSFEVFFDFLKCSLIFSEVQFILLFEMLIDFGDFV